RSLMGNWRHRGGNLICRRLIRERFSDRLRQLRLARQQKRQPESDNSHNRCKYDESPFQANPLANKLKLLIQPFVTDLDVNGKNNAKIKSAGFLWDFEDVDISKSLHA
ncbi:MAG TPA: hypothetical protein VGF20_15960, partial [Candidatus Acidoferrum sp.]